MLGSQQIGPRVDLGGLSQEEWKEGGEEKRAQPQGKGLLKVG